MQAQQENRGERIPVYTFQISPYSQTLRPQVRQGLEKRTELLSRAKCPKLWKYTDRLNARWADEKTVEKRRGRYRIYGVVLVGLGLFLLVPGLMEPGELMVPLVAGVLATAGGMSALWQGRKKGPGPFDKAAEKLLRPLETAPEMQVHFTQWGMDLGGEEEIPYPEFTCIVETEDLFQIFWQEKVTLLQKGDMCAGNGKDFSLFLDRKAPDAGKAWLG